MFQFLNGTIITYVGIVNTCSLLVSIPQWYDYYRREFDNLSAVERGFNSSMVRLLLRNTNKRATYHLGFNSSMVRLLLDADVIEYSLDGFQFLNGTIITKRF